MTFHTPEFLLGSIQPPQNQLQAKFGGDPWGFPLPKWPRCADCGYPMALLAQLPHEPGVVDLGDPALVLHLFQCITDGGASCFHWDYQLGANSCVLLNRSELSDCLVTSPTSGLIGELWIAGWRKEDDEVPAGDLAAYSDAKTFRTLPQEKRFPKGFDCRWDTKAGGVPYWTVNGPMGIPPQPYEFLLQFGTALFLKGALPDAEAAGCPVAVFGPDSKRISRQMPKHPRANAPWSIMQCDGQVDEYCCEITNLGSDGTGYVFIDRSQVPARAVWFWNR